MPGEFCPLGPHPILEVDNQRHDAPAANQKAFVSGTTVDLALNVEDRINLFQRF
jgi:hypothetical protein